MKAGPFFRFELRKSDRGILEVHGDNLTDETFDLRVSVVPGGLGLVNVTFALEVRGEIIPEADAHLKCMVLPEADDDAS